MGTDDITGTTAILAMVALTTLVVGLWIFHKVRRIHLMMFALEDRTSKRIDNHFSQEEALIALYYELQPRASFPSTRNWAGSPDFLLHVMKYARRYKPINVVECSSGVSTIVLARALELNGGGHVYSLEHDSFFAEKTRDEIRRHGLENFATVIDAPLGDVMVQGQKWRWYSTSCLPEIEFDLLVIDGPPMATQFLARYPALPLLGSRLTRDAAIFLDDASRPDEQEIVRRWLDEQLASRADELYAEKGIAFLRLCPK